MNNFVTLLTDPQVEQIHQAALEVLEKTGLLVRNEKARQVFARHGCQLEQGSEVVRFPRQVVEEYRKMMPSTFSFLARDPQYDRILPKDGPVMITASSAPNIIDPVTGKERRATSSDIARIAHLVQQLPGYDVFSVSTLADDARPEHFTLGRLYPAMKYCSKPLRINSRDLADTETILKLGYLVAGSQAAYRDHPFITHHYCPVVSPLTMDFASTEMLIYCCEQKLPVYPTIVPNAGLTSPMSLAGTLAQGNAEFLAAACLMQMVQPGTPLIYATLPTVADMRSGAYASGGIECGMLHMACAQLARFYNVPYGGYIGLTNAKVNDAQAGFETGMSATAGFLSGMDMLNMNGLLDALKVFDFGKAVVDDEICLMLKRIKRGFEFSDDEFALEVINQVGPGGSFMVHPHTMARMKTSSLLTKVADRSAREGWEKKGALDTQTRAMQRAHEVLSKPSQVSFSPELDGKIRAAFPGLVPGNLELPAGW